MVTWTSYTTVPVAHQEHFRHTKARDHNFNFGQKFVIFILEQSNNLLIIIFNRIPGAQVAWTTVFEAVLRIVTCIYFYLKREKRSDSSHCKSGSSLKQLQTVCADHFMSSACQRQSEEKSVFSRSHSLYTCIVLAIDQSSVINWMGTPNVDKPILFNRMFLGQN